MNPQGVEASQMQGVVLAALGRVEEAARCFRRTVELKPDYAEAHQNLSNALSDSGRLEEAVACARRALELAPDLAAAHNTLGVVLAKLRRADEAVDSFRRALALAPDDADTLNNLANALVGQGKVDEAIASSRRALELRPDFAGAYNTLGAALVHQGKWEEAESSYRRAITLDPGMAEAHFHLGAHLLLHGRFEEGWREYEHRLHLSSARPRALSKAQWKGERTEGRTILIQSEQGYGDALQFVRYLPLVRERSGAQRILLEAQPRLARLFSLSGGWGADVIVGPNEDETPPPPHDYQVPLASLPLTLGLAEPLTTSSAYIRADPRLRLDWRERLGTASVRRVGLVWAGSPNHQGDRLRSLREDQMRPLLETPGFCFYSLQLGPQSRAPALEADGLIDLTEHLGDFADTAAFVAELDLIISVDTAVAHLAGAMGRPVWTLVTSLPDWRWGVSGETTRWYPTMRLFRQKAPGDWDEVVRRVASELARFPSDECEPRRAETQRSRDA
jgi:tetratricopeptide (TPR) repeat protein